ncbi:rhamnogalacturonan endolyase [Litchfieldia salsa]|uniref:Rhamnogalacturonan endolyase n=2 Tax=Litchfieldia salsa TaxID=930152 RepID=A0A1H0PL82_9BACI|nr:rhamnogalacturonan endolyase [Litchfieldia salsa]
MAKNWAYLKMAKGIVIGTLVVSSLVIPLTTQNNVQAASSRQMESLDRGLTAVKTFEGVFISWRLFGTEPSNVSFNLYRNGQKVNSNPISSSTNYLDANGSTDSTYYIKAVINNTEQAASESVKVWGQNYLNLPIQKPSGGTTPDGVSYSYSANDASVGDLDGDGDYEIIVKWDPSNSKDNSQDGYTGNVYVDAYHLDGTRLWRINLGKNIRAGAHYTQFVVYDLDGDGRSEVAMKTADGTVDGQGSVIGSANADYRDTKGRVLSGPEYLTIFSGGSGRALENIRFKPERGNVCDWGDCYGNRVDRFLAGVAYLDGQRPSLIMGRGYYNKTMLTAYNYRNGDVTELWTFDSDDSGNENYAGQGNHSLSAADLDGDGKDEIVYGAMAIDDNGRGLHTTGWGHGDAHHVGDLNPNHSGIEIYQVHENANSPIGMGIRDGDSGQLLWGIKTGKDTGRGVAADIDPRYAGTELWASGQALYSVTGSQISSTPPSSMNSTIWWDGDLSRELLDHKWSGSFGVGTIYKWNYQQNKLDTLLTASGTFSNNGTKGNPSLQVDLFGDWREEVIWRTEDSSALRIYTTTHVTTQRIFTLMHDALYRTSIASQNTGYNQPPHTSFYLGSGMKTPSMPSIYTP